MEIKQILCPIKGSFYLCGGFEFGHQYRRVQGNRNIICRKCGHKVYVPRYDYDSKEAKELLRLIN